MCNTLRYISAWFAFERNASEYVNKVVEWRDSYGMDGVYSDGLPEDEWLIACVLAPLVDCFLGSTVRRNHARPEEHSPH